MARLLSLLNVVFCPCDCDARSYSQRRGCFCWATEQQAAARAGAERSRGLKWISASCTLRVNIRAAQQHHHRERGTPNLTSRRQL
ncbi:hypothetical protein NDU88_007865 [Pleurodeles waltl]|uniref:Secreted protein n=1 Tax=Pleurodeles waltl TaxID=8319 RepID=A0AAV7RT02_PLEWA|nr:hypothetical protein NDU88_007865 [Pleurodeles waltl]